MRIRYEEGLEMGYRARSKPTLLFPFGFGKSHTDFKLVRLAIEVIAGLSAADLKVPAIVTNVGPRFMLMAF